MISLDILEKVIDDQHHIKEHHPHIQRRLNLPDQSNQVVIVTGIRRCGKSTILLKTIGAKTKSLYISFEDPRLEGFSLEDFMKIETLGKAKNRISYIFDEIQNIPGWEKYIRSAHDRGIPIYISGSNASLLSRELGTRLTGRYKQFELFPFSYPEYLDYTGNKQGASALQSYLSEGGFPEYLRDKDSDYLRQLLNDIIIRDIVVRRKIRNEQNIIRLAIHLLSNVGKEYSYNKLSRMLEISSVRSTIDYCDYLKESYILDFLPMYSPSIRKQIANPKKAYSSDNGLTKANSLSFSEDWGRMLENAVFQHLRRTHTNLMYYKSQNSECDFLVREKNKIQKAIQVCWYLHEENMKRELRGIENAMKETKAEEGYIITYDQEDEINGIPLIPAWKWFCKE